MLHWVCFISVVFHRMPLSLKKTELALRKKDHNYDCNVHKGKTKVGEMLGLILGMYSVRKPELQYMHWKRVSTRCRCYTEPGFALVITADGNTFPKAKHFPLTKLWPRFGSAILVGIWSHSSEVTVIKNLVHSVLCSKIKSGVTRLFLLLWLRLRAAACCTSPLVFNSLIPLFKLCP